VNIPELPLVLLPVLLELEPELEEELLDPETEMGSRMVDKALLIVLINAQVVRTGVGRPGPRLMAGGLIRRRLGRWLHALQQGEQRLRLGVSLRHGGNRRLLQYHGFAQVGRLLRHIGIANL